MGKKKISSRLSNLKLQVTSKTVTKLLHLKINEVTWKVLSKVN